MTENKKILLIEDDVFMVGLLVHELQEAGFEVVTAKTGVEGIKKFPEVKPDLILLDILLPDQNGFDTLRTIRRQPGGPGTKVIVLSNLAEWSDVEEAKRLGALDYLVKTNFSLEEIVEKIQSALGR
ncbi:MAG: response regulator [Candidatus Sungiibacteriota bacterium]|uniref:Response regulator n=1 Tax=Candidatus Sungiibacteriota bacterium TaxID=2750080 RepID=A0A7T5RK40_9BACT|nr:MAG: response regulator [Candidatus Sungbacteria bacterium]